jgi:integrase
VYIAGEKFGWGLRETCIARCLFESGARISEVVGLNVPDWASGDFGNHLAASNKGSYGIRVKTLVISSTTGKLLRRYFDDDVAGRRRADPLSLRISDATRIKRSDPKQLDGLPLFLNQGGRRMGATLFRDYYWKPALEAAGIDADPHQARHWFVTNALRNIDKTSTTPDERMRRRQELIQYMAWRSGERTRRRTTMSKEPSTLRLDSTRSIEKCDAERRRSLVARHRTCRPTWYPTSSVRRVN